MAIKTTQNVNKAKSGLMLHNTKEFKNFSYFLAGIDVTNQNLDQFTPYLRGVSRLFVHKLPMYMVTLFPKMSKRFKQYLETGYKSISGVSDIDVEFTSFEAGFNGQKYEVPNLAKDQTETLGVSVYELTGSPIREFIDTWVSGVRDPRSGIAHYHGLIDLKYASDARDDGDSYTSQYTNSDGTSKLENDKDEKVSTGLKYGEKNHTMEFIYTTYDPTGLFLEYSCMFAKCFPRKVPKDHLNYESGNRGEAQLDLEFSTTKYESSVINDIGIWYTQNSKILLNYLDFTPEHGNGTIKDSVTGGIKTWDYGNYTTNYASHTANTINSNGEIS